MIRSLLILVLVLVPTIGSAGNWRVHMKVCNQDAACAKEQAKAQDLWNKQNWSRDLKQSCKKQHIQPYLKDYIGAVNCVSQLENARQEFRLRESEIKRNKQKHRSYRSWGGVRVQ